MITQATAKVIDDLATEAINKIQHEARDYEDAVDIFYDYAYRIKALGGVFIWYVDEHGQEVWHIEAPREVC